MIDREEFFMIRDLKSKGLSITQISEQLDIDRKTVSKWLKKDQLPEYKREKSIESKLDLYKEYLLQRMGEGCVNATVLLEEIQAQGYTGKITILRDFMRPHRKPSLAKASIRYETPPGKQAQVDWGEFLLEREDGTKKKIHAFVMVMGYSRHKYLEFTEDERIDTLIGCHERAFAFFGGLPETILYDNMKTVVKHSHKTGENKWNDKFLRFAKHHGFSPVRCRPYNPRAKGKVENGVKYVRRNFWPRLRSVKNVSDLNSKAILWLDSVCNVRIHKTTRKRPVDAFKDEMLKPQNPELFLQKDLSSRRVMNDCTVSYETNFYSVPFEFVGKRVGIKDLRNGCLEVYDELGNCIAMHEKLNGKYKRRTNKKHFEGMVNRLQQKVAPTAPKLLPDTPPKVHQRPLEVYDSLVTEVIS